MAKSMKDERNKTRTRISLLLIFILPLLFSTHLRADLSEDMVHFEQQYIPVLLWTAQSDPRAVAASDLLVTQWNDFKARHAYAHTDDSLWGFDMVGIERDILDGQRLLQAGNFQRAYKSLSQVRIRFSALRARHKLEFYLDGFNDFDLSMQPLLVKLQQQGTDDVYLEISSARNAWLGLMNREFDFHAHELSLQQVEYLQQCLQKGEQILNLMQQQFRNAEYTRLPALATQMQDVYTNTYAIFAAPH